MFIIQYFFNNGLDAPFLQKIAPGHVLWSLDVFSSKQYDDFKELLLSDPLCDQSLVLHSSFSQEVSYCNNIINTLAIHAQTN